MNLTHLYYFRVLAQTEHYGKAASKLFISQPNLSYAISCLEKELGVSLFEKSGRNIHLTKNGRIFLQHIDVALNEIERAKNSIQPQKYTVNDTVKIAAVRPLAVQQFTGAFRRQPGCNVLPIQVIQDTNAGILESILNGECDLGFLSAPIENPNILCDELYDCDLAMFMPKNHPLAYKSSIDLRETAEYPTVLKYPNTDLGRQINELYMKAKIEPKIVGQARSVHVLFDMAVQSQSIGILLDLPAFHSQGMVARPISYPSIAIKVYMICLKKTKFRRAVKDVRDFVLGQNDLKSGGKNNIENMCKRGRP